MKTLVFLEDHEGKLQKDSLGVLSKAGSLGGEVEAVLLGSEVEIPALARDHERARERKLLEQRRQLGQRATDDH